jgi:hypothetical protein
VTIRASPPAGQRRAVTASTAALAKDDPSMPITIRAELSSFLAVARATRTEQRASVTIFRDTLPRMSRPIAERPCEPTTINSVPQFVARSISASAGSPTKYSALTSHSGKLDLMRSPPRRANSFACAIAFDAYATAEATRRESSAPSAIAETDSSGIAPSATEMINASASRGSPA